MHIGFPALGSGLAGPLKHDRCGRRSGCPANRPTDWPASHGDTGGTRRRRRATEAVRRSWVGRQSALRLGAVLERGNDTGVRCALWPSGDAHRPSRSSVGAATSFGLAAPFARGARGARAVTLATHQCEGLVRVRGRACLRTPAPEPFGSLPASNPSRKGVEHRFEAAEDPFADRPVPGKAEALAATGAGPPSRPRARPWQRGGSDPSMATTRHGRF